MAKSKKKIISFFLLSMIILNLFVFTIYNSFLFTSDLEENPYTKEILDTNYVEDPSKYNDYSKFYYFFDKNLTPLQILTVIHDDPYSFFDEFAMLASIPYTIYIEDDLHKVSPIIYDNINNNTRQFLSEWDTYNNYFEGVKRIIYVGDVQSQDRAEIEYLTHYDSADKANCPPLNFTETNIFDLAASFASSFWGTTDTIIIALAPESQFSNSITNLPVIDGVIGSNNISFITGVLDSSNKFEYYINSTNVTMQGGAFLVTSNTTDNLNLEFIGNSSGSNPWIFDTTNYTNNGMVFIPNLTYPANSSDWAVHVVNASELVSNVPFNLTFYNLTANYHDIKINSSNANLSISLTWSNPTDDLDLWVLNPRGQLISYSDRNGFLYNESNISETNEQVSISFPEAGDWRVIITNNKNTSSTDYALQFSITNFSIYKENVTLSAANAAVLASVLHAPLLYTNGTHFSDATKNFINTRNVSNKMDAILVDLDGSININSLNQSLNVHFGNINYLDNYSLIAEFLYNNTGLKNSTLCSINEDQYSAAAVYSAFKGNYILPTLVETSDFFFDARSNYKIMENGYYQSPLNQFPSFENMSSCSDDFYAWLDSIQTSSDTRSITIFSSLTDLYPTFDRAILGKSRVGRFEFSNPADNLISAQRNVFYPLFSYINKSDAIDIIYSNTTIIDASFQDDDTIVNGMRTSGWSYLTGLQEDLEQENDGLYIYAINDTNDLFPCIGINFSDFDLNPENITSIDIIIRGRITLDPTNSSINQAGWALWNWTENNYTIINNTIFNSSSYQTDIWYYSGNISHIINMTESGRLEVHFVANYTGLSSLQARIDYLKVNVTFDGLFAKQFALFSNISSISNFTFNQTETHNYSTEIPAMFLNQGYNTTNASSYSNIIGNLSNKMALWYYSGIAQIQELNFNDIGNISFDDGNVWKTGTDLLNDFDNFNSCISILNDDYLGSTKIPEYFQILGSTSIISNLGKNILGYSEQIFYEMFQNFNSGKRITDSLIEGLNKTSHLYSLNDAGNVIEDSSDPSNSEDYHQFIIFGDPDLRLVENNSFLIKPGNYKPIVKAQTSYVIRKTYTSIDINEYDWSWVYFDFIDIDSKISITPQGNFIFIIQTISPVTTSAFGEGSTLIDGILYNLRAQMHIDANNHPMGKHNTEFIIRDGAETTVIYSTITIISDAPIFWQYYDAAHIHYDIENSFIPRAADYNTEVISKFYVENASGKYLLSYNTLPEMGRINETFYANIAVGDLDWQDIDLGGLSTGNIMAVNICLKHVETGMWINLSTTLNKSIADFTADGDTTNKHGRATWNTSYVFTETDNFGIYEIYVHSFDIWTSSDSHLLPNGTYPNRFQKVWFFNLTAINWPVELNFSTEFPEGFKNNSAIIWRLNQTLQVNASFFDRDDYNPYGQIASEIGAEGTGTITNVISKFNNSYGSYNDTLFDDSSYQIISNNSEGLIIVPYYVNLSSQGMNFNNITSLNISSIASISFSNYNISYAGWRIWNWTSNDYYEISNNSFNSTSMSMDFFYYNGNLSHFINSSENNRIEIFFIVNMTQKATLNLSIDFIKFEIINNRTGIQASLCLKHNASGTTFWKNTTMIYYQLNKVWNTTCYFSNKNIAGTWYIYFKCTDKDDKTVLINTKRNITVLNHVPNFVNLTLLNESEVYRTNSITFRSNATDYDVYNKSANLTHVLIFHSFLTNTTFNFTMNYNENISLWNFTWNTQINTALGNYSINLTVFDEADGINSTLLSFNITVLNNLPNITLIDLIPTDYQFLENEIIIIKVNFTDKELLLNYSIKIRDDQGNWKNETFGPLIGLNNFSEITIDSDFYEGLIFQNNWTIYITLMDADFASVNLTISLRVFPQYQPPGPTRFPWELIVILGLVITAILASLLVYRFRQKEEEEVPVSRVKAIIKKISDERRIEEEKEQALLAEHEKKELIKKHVKGEKVQKEKRKPISEDKELDKLERKNLEVRLSETLANARTAVKKENFGYAGELYQRAAKIASKLGDIPKSTRFSEQAESYFRKSKTRK
ncbi:MAG: hypothetical protein EAX96_07260 [Candidatus Lokiarchaeota archaeon]|nr:hypothetical protein [Candidatus Lokiarchaeota archaeon]